jgi:hypothetical protein
MKQDEPIDPDELAKNAYKDAYENPVKLNAQGGVHADSMPRVRAYAGNSDRGYGTYTQSEPVKVEVTVGGREGHTEAMETATDTLVSDVARAMIQGTRDKIEGNDPDPERAL